MASPNPSPKPINWERLGQLAPKFKWQFFPKSFLGDDLTFRLIAFSLKGDYDRYCYLRIKYNLTTPVYSKWSRIYPSPTPSLWMPFLNKDFEDIPKHIEIINYLGNRSYPYPLPDLQWSLSIDLLNP